VESPGEPDEAPPAWQSETPEAEAQQQ
jgi:hypothetical protein